MKRKRETIYVTFEYEEIIYIIKTDRLSAYKAWLIKKKIQEKIPCYLTTRTIFDNIITYDDMDINRETISLIGLISQYNIPKNSVVMVENEKF